MILISGLIGATIGTQLSSGMWPAKAAKETKYMSIGVRTGEASVARRTSATKATTLTVLGLGDGPESSTISPGVSSVDSIVVKVWVDGSTKIGILSSAL